jgi:23S rRNA pseudouridine1911/1915/1917 synthase
LNFCSFRAKTALMSETKRQLTHDQYVVTHSVNPGHTGMRLDRFLMDRYRHRSREKLKKAIDGGSITVDRNGSKHLSLGKMKASFALQAGDTVRVASTKQNEPEVNFNYKILFEDEHIAVIDKPPNLPVHPAGRYFFNSLLVHIKTIGNSNEIQPEREFYLVHRIDKETSGVLLLAKTKEACNTLTTQFRNRETQKYYLAIARGKPAEDKFVVDNSIGRIAHSRVGLKMYPVAEAKGGLPSLTTFEVVETRVGIASETNGKPIHPSLLKPLSYTLLACFPKTGRQHQIRVHADIAGHALVGDKIYGMSEDEVCAFLDAHSELMRTQASSEPVEGFDDENEDDGFSDELGSVDDLPTNEIYDEISSKLILPRHALHAAGLKFVHPVTGLEMAFESNLPDDLRVFFEKLTGEPIQPFKTKHWV